MSTTTATLSFSLSATGPDLRLVVVLDDTVIWDDYPGIEPVTVSHTFDDAPERDHTLIFEMRGKLPEHTKIDENGEIIQDRCVSVTDLAFDGIALGHTVAEHAKYYHTNNDATKPVVDSFYGLMGCNGRVEIKFFTPLYLWLLENM